MYIRGDSVLNFPRGGKINRQFVDLNIEIPQILSKNYRKKCRFHWKIAKYLQISSKVCKKNPHIMSKDCKFCHKGWNNCNFCHSMAKWSVILTKECRKYPCKFHPKISKRMQILSNIHKTTINFGKRLQNHRNFC